MEKEKKNKRKRILAKDLKRFPCNRNLEIKEKKYMYVYRLDSLVYCYSYW